MKNIKKLLSYIIPYWKKVVLNILFNLLSVIFSLFSVAVAIPFLSIIFDNQEIILDHGTLTLSAESLMNQFKYYLSVITLEKGPQFSLLLVGLVIIFMTFFKNLFKYIAMYYLSPIRNGITRDIRNQLFSKILWLPLSYYSNERKGDIMARMNNDVQEVEGSLVSSIEMLIRDPLTIIIYIVALFYMSTILTIFVLILLPIGGFIIGVIVKNLRRTSLKGQKKLGLLSSVMEETIGGLRIIKAFNAENTVNQKFSNINNSYTKLMVKIFRRKYLAGPLSEFIGTILMVIIMWYGGILVLGEAATLKTEELIAYLIIFYLIIGPAKSFSAAYYNIQKGLASVDRINSILNAKNTIPEKADAENINDFENEIEYKNVSFQYIDDYVLKNINLTINKGMTVALVGQSGAGKSTMADLIPRFYDVTEGQILIDGKDLRNLKLKQLRDLMGIVTQEAILFNDTFYNNITFGTKNITENDVINAAKTANAHDFIMETTEGYETNIGDRGNKLSGGQQQRISIARAVLKNPPVMIFDEATSSLDTESEKIVQDALNRLLQNRTSIIIAHRLSTVVNADLICVLHEGEIVEKGTHNELLNINGYYKKLHNFQMFT